MSCPMQDEYVANFGRTSSGLASDGGDGDGDDGDSALDSLRAELSVRPQRAARWVRHGESDHAFGGQNIEQNSEYANRHAFSLHIHATKRVRVEYWRYS